MAGSEHPRHREQERDRLEGRTNSTPGRHDPTNYNAEQVETDEEREQREWELAARDVSGRILDNPSEMEHFGLCMYVAHDSPEDQIATFHWFETRSDLFEWMRTALPLNARRFCEGDPQELRRRVNRIMDRIERQQVDPAEGMQQLNVVLEPYCTLEWYGLLHDLMASPNQFERDMRLWYREQREQLEGIELEWGEDPIAAEEMEEFIEVLTQYR